MTVVCLQITAYLAHSSSLKDKRSAVKRLCAQLRREYGASVFEDGLQDTRQWMQLGMAMACADRPTGQRMMQRVEMLFDEEPVLSRLEIKSEIY